MFLQEVWPTPTHDKIAMRDSRVRANAEHVLSGLTERYPRFDWRIVRRSLTRRYVVGYDGTETQVAGKLYGEMVRFSRTIDY